MHEAKHLKSEARLAAPDDFYAALMNMHRDLDESQSRLVNAKLILLLANHIGDHGVLTEAMAIARDGIGDAPGRPSESPDASPQHRKGPRS
jgi:hypothetical protein